jgi:mono/diheme cytochrome c family protein
VIASIVPILATAESEPVGPSNVGLGSVALIIAIVAFLVWVGYVVINSRRRTRRPETPAPNQEFFMDNEGLENDRLTRVLAAAVVAAGVLAIVMPLYFVNETHRQAAAAEDIHQDYLHFGEEWWVKFQCGICHGPDGSGGGAEITEDRSGLTANWAVPSINDVFYRYSEDEVRHWITYGRHGTPMPSAGLEGGGAMTVQEMDQVIEYLRSIQIPQMDAFAKVDGLVQTALDRMAGAEATIDSRLLVERTKLEDIQAGPAKFNTISDLPDQVDALLGGAGTCTTESAALVGTTCSSEGADTDRDGLADEAETGLGEIAQLAYDTLTEQTVDTNTLEVSVQHDSQLQLELSPTAAFSTTDDAGNPVADLDAVQAFISHLNAKHLEFSLLAERSDQFGAPVVAGIDFLENALQTRAWDVDFDQVAADTGLSVDDATRAVGLFNAYCARCHTAGYSAGVAFEQEPGSGSWAPELREGRAVVQFPDEQDHIDFVINGAEAAAQYGVNGLSGVGGMPAFGALLSADDIELIVKYERSL